MTYRRSIQDQRDLAKRMVEHGLLRVTNVELIDKEGIRRICRDFANIVVGYWNGKPETYASCYLRIYAEPLRKKRASRAKRTASQSPQTAPGGPKQGT